MKEYFTFSKAPTLLEPQHQVVSKQFNFKQFSLAYKTVPFQTIQFSISIYFKYQTVLFQPIQFSISMQFKCQNSSISSNSVQHKYAV